MPASEALPATMGLFGSIGSMKQRSKPEEQNAGMYERTKSAFFGSNVREAGEGDLPAIKQTCAKSFSVGSRAREV